MKLIDAECLKAAVRKAFPTLEMRCAINEIINAAPSVDAIPVEWIQAQRTEPPQTVEEFARNVAYRTVLYGWRAEQEDA